MKINNVVCSLSLNFSPVNFDEIQRKLQNRRITYNIRQLNQVNVIQFRHINYSNTMIRIFPSGRVIVLISKPLSFEECDKIIKETKLFLNDLFNSE